MSEHNITVQGGSSVRLPTAGKYCDRDIVVQATPGGVELPELTNEGAASDLMKGKQLISGVGGVVNGSFSLDSELSEQDTLISQIKTALAGKAVAEAALPTQEKNVTITENGSTIINPDAGYTLSKVGVTVNVPIPDGYIVPSGTKEISENGTYDVTDKKSVVVSVPEREIVLQNKEITENGTYTADAGYDGFGQVTVNVAASGGGEVQVYGFLNNTITDIVSDVTSVVAYACRGLSKLKTVDLPNATSIGTYAFYYCTSMTRITVPKVTTLNTYAFYNCDKLANVNFPLATNVPTQCFYSCGILSKADFGAASSIESNAFVYCEGLTALILRRANAICTLANKNALTDTAIANGTGYVYVPAALIDTYRAASNWSTYAAQFRAIEDYPDICG